MTLGARQLEDVVQWLLGWGSHVRVLDPPDLQARLMQEARAIAALYPACE